MSDVYQCKECEPNCFLFAPDDDNPMFCPFGRLKEDNDTEIKAEWRQIQ